jgi:hypothetical protein
MGRPGSPARRGQGNDFRHQDRIIDVADSLIVAT